MRRDSKMAPDQDAGPCCPDEGSPETVYKSSDQISVSGSMDLCEPELPNEDEFLTSLSADTPGGDMNDIFGSVFGDSSSSLELLTPIEGENPQQALLSSTYKPSTDQTTIHPQLHQLETQGIDDHGIFLSQPFLGLGDDLNNDNFCDFTTSAVLPPFEGMVPSLGHVPELDMGNGYSSESSPGMWGPDLDLQMLQSEEAARMTIVIDEARPETLTEVMKVLMESRARVEFRRG